METQAGRVKQLVFSLLLVVGAVGATLTLQRPQAEPLVLAGPVPEATLAVTVTPAASAMPAPIVVFVSGAVREPGVYTLPPGSRVVDALQAAGGPTAEAAVATLNQATPLQDGMQIHMPAEGEVAAPPPVTAGSPAFATPAAPGGTLVHLNSADAASLETLPGIGPALAERIIAYRTANGSFTALDQLKEVQGIGDKLVEQLKDHVVLD